MKGLVFGIDQAEFENQLNGKTASDFLERGLLAGTPNQIVDQLGQLKEIGVQKVMLQWSDYENILNLENFSNSILPHLKTEPNERNTYKGGAPDLNKIKTCHICLQQ